MKRAVIIFIVALLVLGTVGMWIYSSPGKLKPFDLLTFGIIIIVIAFAVFIGIKKLAGAKRGEPDEDELSKKVILRTAAWSYYISLYLWVAMLYIKDRVNLDTEEIIGTGILGMAVSWVVCWLIFHFRGIRNE